MDWKDNLGNLMSENNHYRLDFLNKQLKSWCKEWTDYMNEFVGMSAELTHERREYSENLITCNYIKVTKKPNWPFKAYLGFFTGKTGKLSLYIAATVSYNFDISSFLKNKTMAAMDSDDNYFWHNEKEITDAEIIEKGYVLQVLNNRYKDYLSSER